MEPFDRFDRAAAVVTGLLDELGEDELALPTACSEWDVRGVINHLVNGNMRTAAWPSGAPAPEVTDRLGTDFRAAWANSVADLRIVLGEPGLFDRQIETPVGTVPGSFMVHMRVNEYLAHGWDIADATGRPTDFEPYLAEEALAEWHQHFGMIPRKPGGPFGEEVPAPPDATPADRLAAFLGRTPRK